MPRPNSAEAAIQFYNRGGGGFRLHTPPNLVLEFNSKKRKKEHKKGSNDINEKRRRLQGALVLAVKQHRPKVGLEKPPAVFRQRGSNSGHRSLNDRVWTIPPSRLGKWEKSIWHSLQAVEQDHQPRSPPLYCHLRASALSVCYTTTTTTLHAKCDRV